MPVVKPLDLGTETDGGVEDTGHLGFQLVEIGVVAIVLNCLLARFWMRPVWDDLWLRIRRMLPSRAAA